MLIFEVVFSQVGPQLMIEEENDSNDLQALLDADMEEESENVAIDRNKKIGENFDEQDGANDFDWSDNNSQEQDLKPGMFVSWSCKIFR